LINGENQYLANPNWATMNILIKIIYV